MWKQLSFMLMVLIGLHLAKADDCLENELKCRRSEQCYPKGYRCDGYADCDDGTDECGCEDYVCQGNQLKCPDGLCGREDGKVCDGLIDCTRSIDEEDCESCVDGAFHCSVEKKCIPSTWFCDGMDNCNGEDEMDCADYVCQGNQLKCPDGLCGLEDGKVCDGYRDCPLQNEEEDCDSCVGGAFHCSVEKKCIPSTWFCDGMDDCNGEDEIDCADYVCQGNQLKCPDGFCGMEDGKVCDGYENCLLTNEEEDCDSCVDGAFHCSIEKKCIRSEWHCDGIDDCDDGEDELDCTGPPPQEPARSLHKAHGQRTKKDEVTVHTVAREQRRKKDEDTVHTITREQRRKKDESKVHTVSREQRRKKDEDTVARSNKDIDAHRKFLRRGKSNLKDNLMNYLLHRKTDDRLANRILSRREMDKRRP